MKYTMKGNYFDGRYNTSETKGPDGVEKFISRECPSDISNILWEMPVDYTHVEPVLESSVRGYKFWRKLPLDEKISFLKRYQEQLISKKDDIAKAISYESGKPLWEAIGETNSVIGKVDVTINDSLPRITNKTFPEIMPGTTGHIFYKPHGPSFIIGPFNFPCHLANTQILTALIAGNSIILKPSEKTAYSAQLMIDCFHEAGFPKGVINLIQGDGEIAKRILKDRRVRAVFFTGSKEVGVDIVRNTHHDFSKLVALELGGKNPAIVHKDANTEHALEELIKGAFLTTGQRCTSTSLVAIHRSLHQEFISKFHEVAKKVVVDHSVEYTNEPFMGPLIDKRSLDTYLLFQGMAKREGIEEVMRGKHLERSFDGYYVSPSIHFAEKFDHNSHFLTNEIFGPNCTFIPYDEIEEAIEIANATEYGLASCVFTKDRDVFQQCVDDVESGLINLNRSTCGASPKLPFGGIKNSGNHHPMAVAAIDSCAYQMASLEILDDTPAGFSAIKGIDLD